jgi:hypothetical protein
MVLDQQLLANFGLTVIPVLEVLSAPSLRVKTEPGVDSGISYAMLEEVPVWFWHLALFFFSHLSVTPSTRGSDPRVEILCG